MAACLGAAPRVRDLLLSEPLHQALHSCSTLQRSSGTDASDVLLLNKIAKDVLDSISNLV